MTTGFGRLDALLNDPTVTEVIVNGGRDLWVERAGALIRVEPGLRTGEAAHALERMLAPLGLRADAVSPVVEARLADGARLQAVVPPIALDGPTMAIRRFRADTIPLTAFTTVPVAALIDHAVQGRANIVVSGATSSGKTTLLNALADRCHATERIITIEDAAELRLPGDNIVRLEARRESADGLGAVTIRELVRAALRLRPDRIVVGEVRGAEALDMLQALNTGHDGSLTTVHANSALDALSRLDTLVLQAGTGLPLDAVRDQVHRAVDLVVHVARAPGGWRRIDHIIEVKPSDAAGPRGVVLVADDSILASPTRPWCQHAWAERA